LGIRPKLRRRFNPPKKLPKGPGMPYIWKWFQISPLIKKKEPFGKKSRSTVCSKAI